VLVDPIKPIMWNLRRTKHLKLICDELLSSFAFKFNLCRYIQEWIERVSKLSVDGCEVGRCTLKAVLRGS
jgi:hypothetical protein